MGLILAGGNFRGEKRSWKPSKSYVMGGIKRLSAVKEGNTRDTVRHRRGGARDVQSNGSGRRAPQGG